MIIRKTVLIKEIIETDGVGEPCEPITRVAVVAVVKNPFAGQFVDDLSPLFDMAVLDGARPHSRVGKGPVAN